MMVVRAAGCSHPGTRPYHEDRWAVAELPSGSVAAVADGMSDPSGDGRGGASAAVAEVACHAFVEVASRLLSRPAAPREGDAEAGPEEAVRRAFAAAADAALEVARRHGGGAAFVGAWLGTDGRAACVKVGDCRAWARVGGRWEVLSARDDADRTGALTSWLGREGVATPAVTARDEVDAVLLGSDGLYRAGEGGGGVIDGHGGGLEFPYPAARDLVVGARRAGEADNITAALLARSAARRGVTIREVATPGFYAVAAAGLVAVGVVVASVFLGGAP